MSVVIRPRIEAKFGLPKPVGIWDDVKVDSTLSANDLTSDYGTGSVAAPGLDGVGNSIYVDGTNVSYRAAGSGITAINSFGTGDFAIGHKIYRTSAAGVLSQIGATNTTTTGWKTFLSGGSIFFFIVDDSATKLWHIINAGAVTLETWTSFFVVVSRTLGKVFSYSQGVLVDTTDLAVTFGSVSSGLNFGLGCDPDTGGTIYTGRIDQTAIYKSSGGFYGSEEAATNAAEHYHGGVPGATPRWLALYEWTDISEDVVSDVKAEWGIHGTGPKDRTADPGTMSFRLNNGTTNSGALRGYYTPKHSNARPGFDVGLPLRLVLNTDLLGDTVKFVGSLIVAKPMAGRHPTTEILCADWLEEASRAKLLRLDVQVDSQADLLFQDLLDEVPMAPPNGTLIGAGSDTYPFAFDNVRDESDYVTSEIDKLSLSEYGQTYVSAGVLVFEGRTRRSGGSSPKLALDEDTNIIEMQIVSGRDALINRAQVSVHPRRRDAAATAILFTLGGTQEILRGAALILTCPYSDANQTSQRVGGTNMVAPVATTDYIFNSLADGTGADLTAQISIVSDFGGNSAEMAVTNNGPADGFLTFFQIRGRGLYDFEPVIADVANAGSVSTYGESIFGYDMPYQSDPANADDLARFILAVNGSTEARVASVAFLANWDEVLAEAAMRVEISDQVSITAPSIDHSTTRYFINGVTMSVSLSGIVRVVYDLVTVDTSAFWILEVDGSTELDETTRLGYGFFSIGWILDTSELGTDTFLN